MTMESLNFRPLQGSVVGKIEVQTKVDFTRKPHARNSTSRCILLRIMADIIKDLNDFEEKEQDLTIIPGPIRGTRPIVFEDYIYYAAIQRRAEESGRTLVDGKAKWFHNLSELKGSTVDAVASHTPGMDEASMSPDEIERMNASRALRLTAWISVFYLLTTDIIGPFNAPFAISQVGWVRGIVLYCIMGSVASYTGILLWRLYIRLDSPRYPLHNYPDIAERIFGKTARHICTFLHGLQLIINVATICLGNGQSLSQILQGRLCFSICIVIWALFGMVIGQIRTLKAYGWLANSAVWINLLIVFTSMGFIAHSPPNFVAALKSLGVPEGPVETHAFTTSPLFLQINGIMNMAYAYGGALIFPEVMAEMRRPMDFWKGMVMAQIVIFVVYILYGSFVYSFQGQFSLPEAYQGVSRYAWQTVGNALSLVTGIIAAGLYGNIGLKTIYRQVVQDIFNGPPLMSSKGRYLWSVLVCIYWSLAFIVGSAIPQVQTVNALIAAIAVMTFSYSFPPLFKLGYDVITDAMSADEEYVPGQGTSGRVDNWNQWSRWKRGLFSGRWYFKLFNLILALCGFATACLGMWGAGRSIKEVFDNDGAATSFGCTAPV